jgi:Na+-translocating ferredoxin:NAD+ oxidoreductase subunit G
MNVELRKDMLRFGLVLLLFCAVAGGSLSLTYAATRPRIEAQIRAAEEKASREAMPGATEFRRRDDLLDKAIQRFPDYFGQGQGKVFDALKDGKVIGSVFQLASRGYGGPISMAVAIQDGRVAGFVVSDHKETAGLGSKIKDNPAWGKQFLGKTIADGLEVKKDISAITGATRSSRGAANGIKIALEAYQALIGGGGK